MQKKEEEVLKLITMKTPTGISRNKNNRNQTKWAGLTVKQTQLERELSGLKASLVEIFQSTAESR